VAADRKTAILDAAISAIARRGVRGLRVEEVAADAGVAVSLLYYHFGTRQGLVRAALDHANERAVAATGGGSGFDVVARMLRSELADDRDTRVTSIVWGEVSASAVFEPDLREQLAAATATWVELLAERLRDGQADGSIRAQLDAVAAAERLTALVEGLTGRWLSGVLARARAVQLLDEALELELRQPPRA
jgi:AcrR family transcriptional regulator